MTGDNPKDFIGNFADELKKDIGNYFRARGVEEVSTPARQPHPPPEPNVRGVRNGRGWFCASPELEMKKLLAKRRRDIFQFAEVRRDDVPTPLHARRFTMLEWYRVKGGLPALLGDCRGILRLAARLSGRGFFSHRGSVAAAETEWEQHRLEELTGEAFGTENGGIENGGSRPNRENFSDVFLESVRPRLLAGRGPVVVTHWHEECGEEMLAARENGIDKRAELFLCGVELANGCEELADPAEVRRRLKIWKPNGDFDRAFIETAAAMEGIAGMAMGFDRLVMLSSGADHIRSLG